VVQINIKAFFAQHQNCTNQVYNVAVGKNYSIMDMFNALLLLTGRTFSPQHTETRKGDIRNSLADISLAQNLLNYNPTVAFNDGLKRTEAYFKNIISD
jgi:UDP-N-acetylglucosamine 4-epimerase